MQGADGTRMRVLSDAVNDFTKTLDEANRIYAYNRDRIEFNAEAIQCMREANHHLAGLNSQLGVIAVNLGQLARSPLLGALGGAHGRAENELQSVVTRVDALRRVFERLTAALTSPGASPPASNTPPTSTNPFS